MFVAEFDDVLELVPVIRTEEELGFVLLFSVSESHTDFVGSEKHPLTCLVHSGFDFCEF